MTTLKEFVQEAVMRDVWVYEEKTEYDFSYENKYFALNRAGHLHGMYCGTTNKATWYTRPMMQFSKSYRKFQRIKLKDVEAK
ncbi:MAG: hypothetical protein CMN60_20405 [Sphingobium sp.]|nr:hypothetical protein [Sphingobium sp.]|tara:strand:+ start:130042 stop:130287 length:246 start_codon:yes stop_codon:yes gene_type:complete